MKLYVGNRLKVTRRAFAGGDATMGRRLVLALLPLVSLGTPSAAQGPLTTQDPSSPQPTLPKKMPDLTVPGTSSSKSYNTNDLTVPVSGANKPGSELLPMPHKAAKHAGSRRHHAVRHPSYRETLERPALANVELLEPFPHPPQPPHVTVPAPAYPLDNFVTYFTAPPPPITCRPTHYDRFKPDLRLVDEKPVLCTADNP